MTGRAAFHFALAGARLTALPSGALWWRERGLLVVSDLHLGKSERLARRGGALMPPYETRATLDKLDEDLAASGARAVICLGDSFDDRGALDGLGEAETLRLARMMAGREWIWIEGNHEAGPLEIGGTHRQALQLEGITFRHIGGQSAPEISGHYHPKARLPGRVAPCFLLDQARVILPAYGHYTGGMWCDHPQIAGLMQPGALAVLIGSKCLVRPMHAG